MSPHFRDTILSSFFWVDGFGERGKILVLSVNFKSKIVRNMSDSHLAHFLIQKGGVIIILFKQSTDNRENQRGIECLMISSIALVILNKQAQLSIFAEDCFCE